MPSKKSKAPREEPMPDATEDGYQYEEEDIALTGPRKDGRRIRVLEGSTQTAASFQIDEEDHTLGNALRWMIMKNPAVELCGYSIPHPAEAKLHIRIQTYGVYEPKEAAILLAMDRLEGSVTAADALEKGLDDLIDLCDAVGEKFDDARQQFHQGGKSKKK